MLIFSNENQYNNLIKNGFEKFPNKRDLTILCEFWTKKGVKFDNLLESMISFCKKWNQQFNYVKSENLLLGVLNSFQKFLKYNDKFEFNSKIYIFQEEIDEIKKIKDVKLQKIAFIMVCLAKWRCSNIDEYNKAFIYLNSSSSIKLKDIFAYAKVKATSKEQENSLHELNSIGFINVQLKPLLKYFIPEIKKSGKIILSFDINDNMIDNWLNITLPHCQKCGKPFEKNGNKQKYCKECAKIIKNEQNKAYLKLGK
jgi:hypothetical protein